MVGLALQGRLSACNGRLQHAASLFQLPSSIRLSAKLSRLRRRDSDTRVLRGNRLPACPGSPATDDRVAPPRRLFRLLSTISKIPRALASCQRYMGTCWKLSLPSLWYIDRACRRLVSASDRASELLTRHEAQIVVARGQETTVIEVLRVVCQQRYLRHLSHAAKKGFRLRRFVCCDDLGQVVLRIAPVRTFDRGRRESWPATIRKGRWTGGSRLCLAGVVRCPSSRYAQSSWLLREVLLVLGFAGELGGQGLASLQGRDVVPARPRGAVR